MAEESASNARYEDRRNARRAEPEMIASAWKRRAIMVFVLLLIVGGVGGGVYGWWRLTHVWTVRAQVWASVIHLSPDVDAFLAELYVDEGDEVKAGDPLVRLNDSELQSALTAERAAAESRASLHAQAIAARDILDNAIKSEARVAQASLDAVLSRLDGAVTDLELHNSRVGEEIKRAEAARERAEAQIALLEKGSRAEMVAACRERLESARALKTLYQLEVDQSEELCAEGVISRFEQETKKTRLANQKNLVRQAELELERLMAGATDEELEVARQVLAERESQVSLAKLAAEQSKALTVALKIRQAEVREAEAQLAQAKGREKELTLADEKVKSTASDLARAKADVVGREAAVARMLIRSPVDGLILRAYQDPGELCRKGQACIQLIEASGDRWIEGYIRECDAPLVKIGQKARVEIVVGYGEEIDATVETMGLTTDSVEPEGGGESAASELVWIRLRPVDDAARDALPGMSARARIRLK